MDDGKPDGSLEGPSCVVPVALPPGETSVQQPDMSKTRRSDTLVVGTEANSSVVMVFQ